MYRIIMKENVYIAPYESTQIYKTLSEVRDYINRTYFYGLEIVKKDTLYSIVSRPETLRGCAYKEFFIVEKVSRVS